MKFFQDLIRDLRFFRQLFRETSREASTEGRAETLMDVGRAFVAVYSSLAVTAAFVGTVELALKPLILGIRFYRRFSHR